MIFSAGTPLRVFYALLVVALGSIGLGFAEDAQKPSSKLQAQIFDVGPDFVTRLLGSILGAAREPDAAAVDPGKLRRGFGPQDALEMIGIKFGEGAHCVYDPSTASLEITNTQEQLGLIGVYLSLLDDQRERQISVLFEMIEVDHASFSDWLFDHHIDTDGTPLRRWAQDQIQQGKAAVIETAALTCRSGQRAKTSSGKEYIYPTEYDPPELPNKLKLSGGAEVSGTSVNPTAFDTRHVGTTLEMDAVLGADNVTIDLHLAPEVVRLDGQTAWVNDDVDAKFQAHMPIFYETLIVTYVTLRDGGYAFLGTMRPREASVEGVEEPLLLTFVRGDVGVLPWPKSASKRLKKEAGK